jgi:hypothetical protein
VYFAFFFIDIGRKKEQVPTKKTLFLTFRTKGVAGLGLEPRTSDNDSEKFPITPSRVIKALILFTLRARDRFDIFLTLCNPRGSTCFFSKS